MKIIINSFKNIWVNKPLIINTKNKVIRLMWRNGIWKTNTIDSIIYCFYGIEWLKAINKEFSFSKNNNCTVEISDFDTNNLSIKRVTMFTHTRNINSTLYINWNKSNESEIENYLPNIGIASLILSPKKFISLSPNKKEEEINLLLNNKFSETEQYILKDEKHYNNINKNLNLNNCNEILDCIHGFLITNYNIKIVNEEYEFFNLEQLDNKDNSLIKDIIWWNNKISESLLIKIINILKSDLRYSKIDIVKLESVKENISKNLNIVSNTNLNYNIQELEEKKKSIEKLITEYNIWYTIKKNITNLSDKDKKILQLWTDKFLEEYVINTLYKSIKWNLYYNNTLIDESIINKYIYNDWSIFKWLNIDYNNIFKNEYCNILKEVSNTALKSYIVKQKDDICNWDCNINNIISLINERLKLIESNNNIIIPKEIFDNYKLLENAVSIKRNDWTTIIIDTNKQNKIKKDIDSNEKLITNKYINELKKTKNILQQIINIQYTKWKELLIEINQKLTNYNKTKEYCKVIVTKKIDFDHYNNNKSKFLLKFNIWIINKSREEIDEKILWVKSYNKNKEIYSKLMEEKSINDIKIEKNKDNINKLDASIKIFNLFNKTRKDLNISKLNSCLQKMDESSYEFDEKYNIVKNKNIRFFYNDLSSGEKIMMENILSKVISNISNKKFPFQLIDNLWELDDINLTKIENNTSGGDLIRFYSKISNDDNLKVYYWKKNTHFNIK